MLLTRGETNLPRSQPASRSAALQRLGTGLMGLLIIMVLVGSLVSPNGPSAVAAPALAVPGLSNVGVSPAGGGGPGSPPVTVNPGGQFKGWYLIDNPTSEDVQAALALSVISGSGTELRNANPLLGASCLVPANSVGHQCSLTFTVPSDAPAGTYRVRFTISPIVPIPTPWSATVDKPGWLVIQGGPQLCVSPLSMNFGTAGTSNNLAIQNCGGGNLAWNASSNQGWLGVSSTGGSGNANISVTVNRSGLGPGSYNGTVTISSNGGTRTVAVAMQVPQATLLAGQATGLSINPGTVSPGGPAQINASVGNTGNVTAVYHLFTDASSVCGQQNWTGTLNPGQTAQAALPCNVLPSAGLGSYSIPVKFEMAQPGQGYQNTQVVGTLNLTVSAGPAPIPPQGPGMFFSQTNFWVRDGAPCPGNPAIVPNFLSEFNRFGAVSTLGYPASRPYWTGGFCYQVFQRGILQWRPDHNPPQAVLANTMDWLRDAGKDSFLLSLGVPLQFTGNDGAGGDFNRAVRVRLQWLTDPAIRDAYNANPSPGQIPDSLWDPVNFYGLPTSQPERHGPFTAQRFQRYVLQKWEEAMPGSPMPGSVVGVLAGDLAKEAGLVPAAAMQPEAP
ncbi:MAG: BACON domain-containing protein [Chloroflexi bacterium]|nr:BACON domain-containing protein [Chloroflexota bacterium]